MDLNKAVDIKKKCQNTQNYKKKKILMSQITMIV